MGNDERERFIAAVVYIGVSRHCAGTHGGNRQTNTTWLYPSGDRNANRIILVFKLILQLRRRLQDRVSLRVWSGLPHLERGQSRILSVVFTFLFLSSF